MIDQLDIHKVRVVLFFIETGHAYCYYLNEYGSYSDNYKKCNILCCFIIARKFTDNKHIHHHSPTIKYNHIYGGYDGKSFACSSASFFLSISLWFHRPQKCAIYQSSSFLSSGMARALIHNTQLYQSSKE